MTAILAFWALIPTKDKLYGLLIVALVSSGLWAVSHERSVGATRLAALQTKLATAQAAEATRKSAQGLTNSTSAEVRYVSTINAVIPDSSSPHVLLLDATSATAAVCAASYPTESDDPAESSVEHPRDIGPDLDKIGRDSDAQVTFLQTLIQSCVGIGACKLQQ